MIKQMMVAELRDLDVWVSETGAGDDMLIAYPGTFEPDPQFMRLWGFDDEGFYSIVVPTVIKASVSLATSYMEM